MFDGANTYSGDTMINAGTLNLPAAGAIVSANDDVAAGAIFNVVGTLASTATLNASGQVNFAASTSSGILARTLGAIDIASTGKVTVAAPTASANRTVLITGSLAFAGGGLLDLSGNDLIVHNGNLSQLTQEIGSGFAGYWNGTTGITSSAARLASNKALGIRVAASATFDGQTVASSDVLVKYTYFGDANLDGVVNGSDYTLIDNGFNSHLIGWLNGDFNYDGVVNGDDYTVIDDAFNTQGPALTVSVALDDAIDISQPGIEVAPEAAIALAATPAGNGASTFSIATIPSLMEQWGLGDILDRL